MDEPWCVLGDFNFVLHPGRRIGGIEVSEGEIISFTDCLTHSGLHEFPYVGAFSYGLIESFGQGSIEHYIMIIGMTSLPSHM